MQQPHEPRWLLLIHQIPPNPAYLRVKVGRRLQRVGAVAIKNSVYALPRSEATYEDLQWVLQEVIKGGGDASLCEARFVDGLSDEDIEAQFQAARKADYDAIAAEARQIERGLPKRGSEVKEGARAAVEAGLARLARRHAEVGAIDYFDAPEREITASLIAAIEARCKPKALRAVQWPSPPALVPGSTWVTRVGIHVDRMASGWLIRRFIDPQAKLKFVPAKGYRPEPGELRFDMFEAEYTHEDERCTFEVLLSRFRLDDAGLRPIAEMVHDLDLKDGKFGRPDTLGFERLLDGIALGHKDDEERLSRASAVLDDLYEYYKRKKTGGTEK